MKLADCLEASGLSDSIKADIRKAAAERTSGSENAAAGKYIAGLVDALEEERGDVIDVIREKFKTLSEKQREQYAPQEAPKPEPVQYWDEKRQKLVRVGKAPRGNYTFFRSRNDPKKQGDRIRGTNQKYYFDTEEEAQEALAEFAKKKRYPVAAPEQIEKLRIEHVKIPDAKRSKIPMHLRWLARAAWEHKEIRDWAHNFGRYVPRGMTEEELIKEIEDAGMMDILDFWEQADKLKTYLGPKAVEKLMNKPVSKFDIDFDWKLKHSPEARYEEVIAQAYLDFRKLIFLGHQDDGFKRQEELNRYIGDYGHWTLLQDVDELHGRGDKPPPLYKPFPSENVEAFDLWQKRIAKAQATPRRKWMSVKKQKDGYYVLEENRKKAGPFDDPLAALDELVAYANRNNLGIDEGRVKMPAFGKPGNIDVPALAKGLFLWELRKGEKRNKIDLQKLVALHLGMKRSQMLQHPKYSHKPLEEAMEYAIVLRAREIIEEGRRYGFKVKDTYARLKSLYENQPILGTRSATSVKNQAYSTPVHMAYLMQKMVGADQGGYVYEPTAGTGMLVTTVNPKNVWANEIEETRQRILIDQLRVDGEGNYVTGEDARGRRPQMENTFDVVMANPPFGSVPEQRIQGFRLKYIEHQIMASALDTMKDGGKAAFIVGGKQFKDDGKMVGPQRIFKNWLYSNYNVVHNLEVPGEEYGRQGASYPVRIFIIEGRKTSPDKNDFGPPENPDNPAYQRITSVDDLLEIGGFGDAIDSTVDTEVSAPVSGRPPAAGSAARPEPQTGVPPAARPEAADGDRPTGPAEGADTRPDRETGRADDERAPGERQPGRAGLDETGREPVEEPEGGAGPVAAEEAGTAEAGGSAGTAGQAKGPRGRKGVREGAAPDDAAGLSGAGDTAGTGLDNILNLIDRKGDEAEAREKKAKRRKKQEEAQKGFDADADEINSLFDDPDFMVDDADQIADDDARWLKIKPILERMWARTAMMAKTVQERAQIFIEQAYEKLRAAVRPYLKKFANTTIKDELEAEAQAADDKAVETQAPQEEKETAYQITYRPKSKGKIIDETLIPVNMRDNVEKALAMVEKAVGDIDTYVKEQIGFPNKKALYNALSADQIDGVALALYNLERGYGMIIGDQTGVGKGRIAASIFKWAQNQGQKPIFWTEKPNLFSDFYRDIVDIGHTMEPFIMASQIKEGSIRDSKGRVVYAPPNSSQRGRALREAATGPSGAVKVMRPYDSMVTTYSQVANPKRSPLPQKMIDNLKDGNYFILDESHNASGASNTGEFVREVLEKVSGVVYLSATYAKRPDTMPLYSKTAMGRANMQMHELVYAIEAGGTPLQEWVSGALSSVGQYIRREKSFEGIDVTESFDTEHRDRDEKRADQMTQILRNILDLDKGIEAHVDKIVKKAQGKNKRASEMSILGHVLPSHVTGAGGRPVSTSVKTSNFASVVHNAVRQLMLAMKADRAVERALEALKNGQKPVIALANTMESFLTYAMEEKFIEEGDSINDLTFDMVMERHLAKTMRFKMTLPNGDVEVFPIAYESLPPALQEKHDFIKELMAENQSDLPGSPIDHIRAKIEAAGYSTEELTGRSFRANLEDPRNPTIEKKTKSEIDSRTVAVQKFNDGETDVLIINQAGSTGLSAHAGPMFNNQDPRIYIGAQAELNVDTEVQKMGRVNRKGQVTLPSFDFLYLDLPMEIRPAAVLKRKMASLNANTSAKADSPLQQKQLPDMINKHGDKVVQDWVLNFWEDYYDAIDGRIDLHDDDNMMKTSGRIATAPTWLQRVFYEEVEEAYDSHVKELKDLGMYDLESEFVDYKADNRGTDIIGTADLDQPDNPFAGETRVETLSVVSPKKPYKLKRIDQITEENLNGMAPVEHRRDFVKKMNADVDEYLKSKYLAAMQAKGMTEEKFEKLNWRSKAVAETVERELSYLEIGEGYRISGLPGVDGMVNAILLDVKRRPAKSGNPAAANRITLIFAVDNALQRISFALSRVGLKSEQYNIIRARDLRTFWNDNVDKEIRTTRHMITGNLLQGYESAGATGRLIHFSMADGRRRSGILMPMNYKHGDDNVARTVRVHPPEVNRVIEQERVLVNGNDFMDIMRVGDNIKVKMPKSRGIWGKIYMDSELNALAHREFDNTESKDWMSANFPIGVKDQLVDKLADLGVKFNVSKMAYDNLGKIDDTPDMSATTTPPPRKYNNVTVDQVQAFVDKAKANWTQGPSVEVVKTQQELYDIFGRKLSDRGKNLKKPVVAGVHYKGKVYLVAENLKDLDHAAKVLVHETFRHYGIRRALGKDLESVLMDVYRAKTKEIREIAHKYNYDLSTKTGKMKAADEWLARQDEDTGWHRRLEAAVRKWLRRVFPDLKMSDAEINELLRAGRKYVTAGETPLEILEGDPDLSADEPGGFDYLPDEVAERMEKARGVPRKPLLERIREGWEVIKSERQHFPKLWSIENESERYLLADILRRHQEIPETAKRQTIDMIKEFTKGLDRNEYEHYRMNILLADLMRDINKGLYEKSDGTDKGLPFGFETPDQVRNAMEGNQAVVDGNRNLARAVQARKDAINNIKTRLVQAKLLKKEVMKDDDYFHHQVLMHWGEKYGMAIGSQDVRTKWRPWMSARTGSAHDYNTEYVEAEFTALSQQLAQLAVVDTLKRIKSTSDIYQQLQRTAKAANVQAVWEKLRATGQIEHYPKGHAREGEEVDPFLPFKQKIAMSNMNLGKMAANGKLEYDSEWADLVDQLQNAYITYKADVALYGREDVGSFAFDHPRWFHFLSYLLNKEKPGANWAATIYKAIRERNAFIKEVLGDEIKSYRHFIPEGYREWKPKPDKGWFWANTVADKTVQQVMAGEKAFDDADVKKILAKGRDLIWVLPTGLADTMDKFYDVQGGSQFGVGRGADWIMRFWKQYILLNPYSVVKYNLNNMSGDLDIVMAYNPKILKGFRKAWKDLRQWHRMADQDSPIRKELAEARKLGVIGSGFSMQEVDDVLRIIKTDEELQDVLLSDDPNWLNPMTYARKYWRSAQSLTAMRENILRLAAYRFFLENSDQRLYGASKPKEIDAIRNDKERAAKLARELLGDYGNISHTGGWIRRRLMPFYSWMEINAPRYVYMMRNSKYEQRTAGTAGRVGAVAGKKMIMSAAKFGVRAAGLYAAINLWNGLMFPDEEEELGEGGRRQLHLILGRREDGDIMTLRFQGALSDALSFFGLEDFPKDVKDVVKGHATVQDKLIEAPKAFGNRLFQGLRPDLKLLGEVPTGFATYPDAFSPRPIRDTYEHVLRTFKLEKFYQEAMGKPRRGGDKVHNRMLEDLKSLIVYTADPGEQAYFDSRKYVFDWMEKQGKERPSAKPTKKGNAAYYYKKALRFSDFDAAKRYYDKYIELGGRPKELKRGLEMAHPMAGVPKEKRQRFRKSLKPDQQKKLAVALDWYRRTYRGK